MDSHTVGVVVIGGAGLGLLVWLLHKLGKALVTIVEVVAAAAVVFMALWRLVKVLSWFVKQIVVHPRTTVTVVVLLAWWQWLGWSSLAVVAGSIAVGLVCWRRLDLVSFDQWCGRFLRAWGLRWGIYQPKLPGWLHACGLIIKDDTLPVAVTVNLVGRKKIQREQQSTTVRVPKVVGVKSGPSWDEVRVRLVPGQKPEDFDEATRALASARKVARCQVREIAPNVVSIDFQRRNLLAEAVSCTDLAGLADVPGVGGQPGQVWAGRTEYGQDWYLPLAGHAAHTLARVLPARARTRSCGRRWCRSHLLSGTAWSACPVSTRRAWNWPTGAGSSLGTRSPGRKRRPA